MLFINGFVVVVVAEQPVVVFCSFPYLLQEIREPIRLVVAAPHEGDAGGSAVGDDVVHLPADRVEASPRLGVFLIGRQFLRPPRDVLMRYLALGLRWSIMSLRSKSGASGSRIPSSMSWLFAPPMVKKRLPSSSKI